VKPINEKEGMLSPALEDYLRKMCELDQAGGVRSAELARALGVSRPSVHDAAEKLKEAGLVEKDDYAPLRLTEAGRSLGLSLVERRRLVDLILEEAERNGAEGAREEACTVEHAMSMETARAIASLVAEASIAVNFVRLDQ
jgi:DtxR family Mn-dependent transcriptional regulator